MILEGSGAPFEGIRAPSKVQMAYGLWYMYVHIIMLKTICIYIYIWMMDLKSP